MLCSLQSIIRIGIAKENDWPSTVSMHALCVIHNIIMHDFPGSFLLTSSRAASSWSCTKA